MKTTKLDFPVMSSWMENNGRRLDCNPYLSGAFEAKVILEKLSAKKEPLHEVTKGGMKGIFTEYQPQVYPTNSESSNLSKSPLMLNHNCAMNNQEFQSTQILPTTIATDDNSTFCVGGSPVAAPVTLEIKKDSTTPGLDCGAKCSASSTSVDQQSLSSKTQQGYSLEEWQQSSKTFPIKIYWINLLSQTTLIIKSQ